VKTRKKKSLLSFKQGESLLKMPLVRGTISRVAGDCLATANVRGEGRCVCSAKRSAKRRETRCQECDAHAGFRGKNLCRHVVDCNRDTGYTMYLDVFLTFAPRYAVYFKWVSSCGHDVMGTARRYRGGRCAPKRAITPSVVSILCTPIQKNHVVCYGKTKVCSEEGGSIGVTSRAPL
jgi:hypothetical protein